MDDQIRTRRRSASTGSAPSDLSNLDFAPHKHRMSVDVSPHLQPFPSRGIVSPITPVTPGPRVVCSANSLLAASRSLATPHLRKSRIRSITRTLLLDQATGRPHLRSLATLPRGMQQRLDRQYDDFAGLVLDLQRLVDQRRLADLKTALIAVNKALTETPAPLEALSSAMLFDLPVVLKRALKLGLCEGEETIDSRTALTGVYNETLTIYRELCFASLAASETLALDDELLMLMFPMLRTNQTFDNAVAVAEALLAGRREPFELVRIPDIDAIVGGMSTRQLAFFCRVLALLVFEPDDRLKSAKYVETMNQQQLTVRTADRNQALLIGMPRLLSRLVMLLRSQNIPVSTWTEEILTHFSSASDLLSMLVGMDEADDWAELEEAQQAAQVVVHPAVRDASPFMPAAQFARPRTSFSSFADLSPELQAERTAWRPLSAQDATRPAVAAASDSDDDIAVATGRSADAGSRRRIGPILDDDDDDDDDGGGGDDVWGEDAVQVATAIAHGFGRTSASRGALDDVEEDEDDDQIDGEAEGDARVQLQRLAASGASGSDAYDYHDGGNDGITAAQLARIYPRSPGAQGLGARLEQQLDAWLDASDEDGDDALDQPVEMSVPQAAGGGDSLHDLLDELIAVHSTPPTQVVTLAEQQQMLHQAPSGMPDDISSAFDSDDDERMAEDEDSTLRDEAQVQNEEQDDANPLQSLKAMTLASHQVEIMFVLCNLLGAKRKAEVQDKVAHLGLIPVMEKMWQTLAWDQEDDHEHDPLHGAGCQCSPRSALRVQYLRLIHNFCDRDCDNRENRRLFFTAEQMAEVFGGEASSYVSPLRCQSAGLVDLLMDQMVKQPADSNYRFWLSSCLESFLRGSAPQEQLYVARHGLLKNLIADLTDGTFKSGGANQTTFDLLGEILKFNPDVFLIINSLINDEVVYERLLRVMVSNLVDSNVFVRSLLLSIEHFRQRNAMIAAGATDLGKPYPLRRCRLARFIERNRFQLLRDLMTVVGVDDISQENICCLNTALIFFIYARRRGFLAHYLASIRLAEQQLERPGFICDNFRELLAFWRQYYTHRNKDCLSLEFSSRIRFDEWRSCVETLFSSPSCPESLMYVAAPERTAI